MKAEAAFKGTCTWYLITFKFNCSPCMP
jgi:hypothetical protein